MSRDGEGLPNAAFTKLEWRKVVYQGILRSDQNVRDRVYVYCSMDLQ